MVQDHQDPEHPRSLLRESHDVSGPDSLTAKATISDSLKRAGDDLHLTANTVAQLADKHAEVQSANSVNDAAHHAGPYAIGHVDKIVGDVTVQRNGVMVTLHAGDAVYKNDVIQTGGASSVSISLSDGTALNLVANTHMVLNEYSFDANSNAYHALFTLLKGTFAFLAGKVAHDGDMKIATPVAFMNAHEGATGWAHELSSDEISAISSKLGHVTFSFAVVNEHGTDSHGIYDLLVNDTVIGNIGDPNLVWYLDQDGNLISMPLDHSREFTDGLSRDLIRWLDENNPTTSALGVHGSGSSINPSLFPEPVNLNQLGPSFGFNPNSGSPFTGNLAGPSQQGFGHSNVFIWNGLGGWDLTPQNWNWGYAPTSQIDTVIIQSGKSTYAANYFIGSLSVDAGATLNITLGSLTVGGLTNGGTIEINSSGRDPALVIDGTITLTGGGTNEMLGPTAENFILGDFGATLVDADNLIEGSGNIGGGDGFLTFINKFTVDATPVDAGDSGLLIVDTGNAVQNFGVLEATLTGKLLIEDRLFNFGTVEAVGIGSSVVIDNNSADAGRHVPANANVNTGTIEAISGGQLTIQDSTIVNSGANSQGQIVDGEILAGTGSEILLQDATILEGFVSVQVGGEIETVSGANNKIDTTNGARNGAQPTLVNDGKILINDDSELTLGSSFEIENAGTIELASTGNATELEFNQPLAILSGGGDVILDGGQSIPGKKGLSPSQDIIDGLPGSGFATVSLENKDNTISSAGSIGQGDGALAFTNDALGTVDADLVGQTLLIATGAIPIVNAGLFEAIDGAELKIESNLDNSGTVIAHTSGEVLIEADVTNESDGTIIAHGKDARVEVTGTSSDHVNVDNSGDIAARQRGTVSLQFTDITNEDAGKIVAAGKNSRVNIEHSTVVNDGAIAAHREGSVKFDRDQIKNESDGTISATGQGSEVSFERSRTDNLGDISAEHHGEVVFDRSHIDNSGLIKADDRGEVEFDESHVDNNRHGKIEADGRGSKVEFDRDDVDNSGRIEAEHGGQVEFDRSHVDNEGHGTIEATGRDSKVEFEHDHVNNAGLIKAGDGGGVRFDKSHIDNDRDGTIEADGKGSKVKFERDSVSNWGWIGAIWGGSVEFAKSRIYNGRGGEIEADGKGSEVAFIDDHVSNSGRIEAERDGEVTFDGSHIDNKRHGIIEANGKGSKVTFDRDGVFNLGLIAAEHGGKVELEHSFVINGFGGTIKADGKGSEVAFDRDAVSNFGRIEARNGGEVEFKKSFVDNGGPGEIVANGWGSEVEFDRDIVGNAGLIKAASGGSVELDESAVFNGPRAEIEADGRGSQVKFDDDLVLNSGSVTAWDRGKVDFDQSIITNGKRGEIKADGSGSRVIFDGDVVGNLGSIEARNGGQVEFDSSGIINGPGGKIEADGRDSDVTSENDLIGNFGAIEATNGGDVEFDKDIVGNAGLIEAAQGGNVSFDSVVVDNTGGVIEADGRHATVDFTDTIVTGGKLTDAHGGLIRTVEGTTTFNDLAITNGTQVDVDDGTTLVLTGTIDIGTAGEIQVESHGELDLILATVSGGLIDNHNEIDVIGAATLEGGIVVRGGDMTVETLSVLQIESTATLDGVTVDNNGAIVVDLANPATLFVNDGTAIIGGALLINASGTLDVEAGRNARGPNGAVLDGVAVLDSGVILVGSEQKGSTLTLDDGTTVVGTGAGTLDVKANSSLDIEAGLGTKSDGATLDGLKVTDDGSIDLGQITSGAVLTLDDGTIITGGGHGTLNIGQGDTLDITRGLIGPGATLDGVIVADRGAIDIGQTILILPVPATLTLDDGTKISGNGKFTVELGSTLNIEKGTSPKNGATLDGLAVTNLGKITVGANADLILNDGTTITGGSLQVNAAGMLDIEPGNNRSPLPTGAALDGVTVTDSSNGNITVGATTATTLTLDDGTLISGGGAFTIEAGSTLDIEKGTHSLLKHGATLDGLKVTDDGSIVLGGQIPSGVVLTLDDGTVIAGAGSGTLGIGKGDTLAITKGSAGPGATLDGVIVTDSGNIDIGQTILLPVPATLTLDDGTIIKDGGTVTVETGSTLEIAKGTTATDATLDGVTVTNNGTGIIKIDSYATLIVEDGAKIAGGKLAVNTNSTLDVELGENAPAPYGATLDDVQVTLSGTIAVAPTTTGAVLTLDDGTVITGGGTGALTIGSGAGDALDIEKGTIGPGATLDGVKVTDDGEIDVGHLASGAVLILNDGTLITGNTSGALVIGTGDQLDIQKGKSGPGATLDGVNVTDGGSIDIGQTNPSSVPATLTLSDGTVIKGGGTFTVEAGSTLEIAKGTTTTDATLDGLTVTNQGQTTVDGSATLLLEDGAKIVGGKLAVNINGTLDVEQGGNAAPPYATLDDVQVTLDGAIAVAPKATGAVLTLDDGTVIKGGGVGTLAIGASGNTGTVDVEATTGATLDDVKVTAFATADTIDVGQTTTATLVLKDGTIMTGGTLAIGASGSTGTVDIEATTGATLDGVQVTAFATADTIEIGQTTAATLSLDDGTLMTGGTLVIGAAGNTGTVDVEATTGATLDGVTVTAFATADTIEIGQTTAATLLLDGGASLTGGTLTIGAAGSTGTVNVESTAGATLDGVTVTISATADTIEVGHTTNSKLLLKDGTSITGGSLAIGTLNSTGTLDVESASGALLDGVTVTAADSGDSIEVGQTGTSKLVLDGGATVTGGTLAIGASGSIGTVDVESTAGATLDGVTVTAFATADTIEVGLATAPTLLLDGGTTMTGGTLAIGASGNTGTVDVESSAGATLDGVTVTAFATADTIEVGHTSNSKLLLEDGTSIAGGSLAIGTLSNIGTLDVESAPGATLDDVTVTAADSGDSIEVGQTGTSKLLLDGGATVTGGTLAIGASGSIGTVDVESASGATLDGVTITTFATADTIEVGQTTTATLLLDGGTSMTGGTLAIGASGSIGTVDVESTAGATLDGVTVTAFATGDTFEVGHTTTATLLMKDGTSMTGGALAIGAAGNTGTVDVESTTGAALDDVTVTAFATADTIEVGHTSNSKLLLKDGTSIAGGSLAIGTLSNIGTLDVESASGATLDDVAVTAADSGDSIEVGQTGTSKLVLDDGTIMTGGTLALGAATGTGTVDVESASGATLDGVTVTVFATADTIEVGQTTTATLLLDGGTTMTGGTLVIGAAGSTGTVDVEATTGATLDGVKVTAFATGDTIEVGHTMTATLLLKDGTSMSGGAAAIGASGNTGTVDVESTTGATLDGVSVTAFATADTIEVGQTSSSTLLLDDGTRISAGTLALGSAGGIGTVQVESLSGAALHGVTVTANNVSDGIEIGKTGTSTLTMDGGTTMTGGTVTIDTDGTLQVDPSLAILSGVNVVNSGNIVVDPGVATLELEAGTTITGGNINVGADGTLEIDNSTLTGVKVTDAGIVDIGVGDTFDPTDTLTFSGAGTLDIEAGAQFNMALSRIDTDDIIDLKGLTVTSAIWDGSHLLLNGTQAGFSISGGLPAGDTFAFKSDNNGGTDLKVATQLVHVSAGAPGTGTEGSAIAVGLNATVDSGATMTSYLISGIPAGAVLSDGHNSFTADATHSQVDINGWTLASLTITPANDTDFSLSALVTATDSQGYSYSAEATESVTVAPLPPVVSFTSATIAGAAGAPNAIALSVTVGGESGANGDGANNSIQSVVITGIPDGAVLTDGGGHHTATVTGGSLDITGWDVGHLTFSPTSNGVYALTATVTEQDADNPAQISKSTATEQVGVITAPYITSNDSLGPTEVRPSDVISAHDNVSSADTVTYQWFSSVNNYASAIGSGATYAVQSGDGGNSIKVVATVTDPGGATSTASSAPLSVDPIDHVFQVHNTTELNNAIVSIADLAVSGSGTFSSEIVFDNDITLTSNLSAIDLAPGIALVIDGGGHTLDGNNQFRGLFALGGNIQISNLAINHTLAQGGAGGNYGGGGGAGLGGGLFVAAGATVAINDVTFSSDRAIGGAGGGVQLGSISQPGHYAAGGGGMGTAGATYAFINGKSQSINTDIGGPAYYYSSRPGQVIAYEGTAGGTLGLNVPGHASYATAAPGSRFLGVTDFRHVSVSAAGNGGFGGGGGSGLYSYSRGNAGDTSFVIKPGNGGFGGGGGAGQTDAAQNSVARPHSNTNGVGGAGGFGGGGGGGSDYIGGNGGYGAGHGGGYARIVTRSYNGGGGGGLGAGGGIFVQEGGHLTFGGGSLSGNTVAGGAGGAKDSTGYGGPIYQSAYNTAKSQFQGQSGSGLGAGIFIQGNDTVTFAPVTGDSLTISDVIADQHNNGGTGNVEIAGGGTVHFAAANTYQGTTLIDAGATLDIDTGGVVGAGVITDNGILNVNTTTTFGAAVSDGGVLNINATTHFEGTVYDNGVINLDAEADFAATVGVGPNGTLNFTPGHLATALFETAVPIVEITGFSSGDTIDLRSIAATSFSFGADHVLSLNNASGTTIASLNFDPAQIFSQQFGVSSDGHGGTLINLVETTFSVDSAASLSAALAAISVGGGSSAANFAYTIQFTKDISLSSLAVSEQLAGINLESGDTLLIDGAGFTLDGANAHRGFFDNAGSVTIENLTIANMLAQGGAGATAPGGSGGGGAGLGGGLFVAVGASATIENVVFANDAAHGGTGGGPGDYVRRGRFYSLQLPLARGGAGGGGMGTDGSLGSGQPLIQPNPNFPTNNYTYMGGSGGGSGIANLPLIGGGGMGGSALYGRQTYSVPGAGSQGGFGGGGGGGGSVNKNQYYYGGVGNGGNGGFGGGGGGGNGGAAGYHSNTAFGGFGGGNGGRLGTSFHGAGNGGGGLGAGGGVFVQEGGSLTIAGGSLYGGSAQGGAPGPTGGAAYGFATGGQGLGSGIFIQGNDTVTLSAISGQTLRVADVIADQGGNGGKGAVEIKGPGIVEFDAANTYVGGTTIDAGAKLVIVPGATAGTGAVTINGTLELTQPVTFVNALTDNGNIQLDSTGTYEFTSAVSGTGAITFAQPLTTLQIDSGVPTATFDGMGASDAIDLRGVAVASIGPVINNSIALFDAGGATLGTLHFDPAQQGLATTGFLVSPDGHGGTTVRLSTNQFMVSTAAELALVMNEINNGGILAQTNTSYEIDLTGDISLTANLPAISLASGDMLTVGGNGHTLSGGVGFELRSGGFAPTGLTIANTTTNIGLFFEGGGPANFSAALGQTLTENIPISGNGTVDISGAGDVLLSGGFVSGSQTIDISGSGDVTLSGPMSGNETINLSGTGNVTLSGAITNGPINVTGAGDLTISGPIFAQLNDSASGNITVTGSIFSSVSHTGTGQLILMPTYQIASVSDLVGAINAIDHIGPFASDTFNLTADLPLTNGLPAISLTAGDTLTVDLVTHIFDGATNGAGSSFEFAPSASGGIASLTGTPEPTFSIGTPSDLTMAINAIDVGGLFSAPNLHYVFNMTGDVQATALPAIDLAAGDTLTVNATGHAFDGATGTFIFTAPAGGGAGVFSSASAVTFADASASDLQTTLSLIDSGGFFSATNTNYVINLTGDVPFTAGLPAVALSASDTLTVNLAGHAFDGATSAGNTLVFSAPIGGGSTVLINNPVPTFSVGSASDLASVLGVIDVGGFLSSVHTDYVINLTGDVLLTGGLPAVHLAAGDTLTINGAGHSIDGGNTYTGLYLQSGTVAISNLTIKDTVERGGGGGLGYYGGGGGGGLGAGGGLFVGSAAFATIDNVTVTHDAAIGGGGAGSTNGRLSGGAGGTLDGRSPYGFGQGGGGGLDQAHNSYGGGGNPGGGGGGGGFDYFYHRSGTRGANGGYGGGNGGASYGSIAGGGGGGAGLGGGVFVAPGGSLTIEGGSISGNSVVGGSSGGHGATPGQGIGAGLFTFSQTVNLAPAQSETLTISDAIAGGGSGVINIAGPGSVVLSGAITGTTIDISSTGAVTLPAGALVNDSFAVSGAAHYTLTNDISGNGTVQASGSALLILQDMNSLTGGMMLSGTSTIELNSANATGSGIITFALGADATLIVEAGDTPTNQINGFNPGNMIELVGFGADAAAAVGPNNIVTVSDQENHTAVLQFNPGVNMSLFHFGVTAIAGGVELTDTSTVPLAINALVTQPLIGGTGDLRGTASPGSNVSIVANGGATVLGSGVADDGGNFDITTSALAEGVYSFQAIDQIGPSTQTSSIFIVDVFPSAPLITTQVTNNPFNGDAVELKGTGEANQTINLYIDGSSTVLATTTTDGNGNFDVFTPSLADGAHTVRATETDSAGLTSPLSAGFAFNVNPTPPTIGAVVGQPFNGGHIEVKGTGEANRTIEIFADNGTTVVGTGTTNGSGVFDFSTSATFTEGLHTLTAVTLDSSNLVSTASNTVTVDVGPSAPVFTLVGQPINGGTIEINGTGAANEILTVFADGGTTPVYSGLIDSTGHFDITTTIDFADGVHHLAATVTNPDNLTSPVAQLTVNVLPQTPVIASVVPVPGTTQQIEVQGTAEAGETIKLFADGSTTVLASDTADQFGHFDIVTNIVGGSHTITATETDSAGLVSAMSTGGSVNVTPNAPVITTLVGQPLNGDVVSVTGTAQHPGGTITLYADGGSTAVGSGMIAGNDTFAIAATATFADGIHTFTAIETDNGISSAASVAFTVDVEPTAPTNVAQVGTTTQGGSVEVTGMGEAGETITLSIGGVTVATGPVDQSGNFDIHIAGLNPGIQSVSAIETDADNLGSTASSFNITVVPAAPMLTSVSSVDDPHGQIEAVGTGVAGAIVNLFADGGSTLIGSGIVDATGHFAVYSSNSIALAGSHDITATLTAANPLGSVTSVASAPAHVVVATVANSWTIASASDLANAIAAIDLTGSSSQPNTDYTFNIVGNLKLTSQLPAFNLAVGDTLTIHGNGATLDANGLPGLFVYAGAVEIDNLSIINAEAIGGAGSGGGGGGAGLGGGLFIASAGAVTLDTVTFAHDQAVGGAGSRPEGNGGGGGGLGGAGSRQGGGGIGQAAVGGTLVSSAKQAGPGIVLGAAAGGGAGGADGGGGNGSVGYHSVTLQQGASGGGIGGDAGTKYAGGAGGFGGGGGGGAFFHLANHTIGENGGAGGFGGGGGGANFDFSAGAGGFGGGGGATGVVGAKGGFGAGGGSEYGGSGLGAGGAIFIQQGGSLTFAGSGSEYGNSVAGGSYGRFPQNAAPGSAFGSGLFLQGNETVTFTPGVGKTITVSDAIADMTGSNDHTLELGAGGLVVDGQGTLVLSGNNTFTGGILLKSGTLDVVGAGAGLGAITLVHNGAPATLEIDAAGGLLGNAIIVDNFQATSETFAGGVLTLTDASGDTLNIDVVNPDPNFGTDLNFTVDTVNLTTTITGIATSWTDINGGDWGGTAGSASTNWSSIIPTTADDTVIAPAGTSAAYTVSIFNGELAQAHNLTINDANATIDDAGMLVLSGGLNLAVGTFHLDGGSLQTALSLSIASGATFEGDGMVSVGGPVSGTVIASDTAGPALDFVNAVTGNGNFHINAGATLEFGGSVASGTTVTFDGGTGELKLDAPGSFAATIAGFTGTAANAAHSDVIDLAGINETSTGFTETYAGGVLTVSDGTNTANLTFSNFNDTFKFASDGNGGTLIYDPPVSATPNASASTGAAIEPGHNFVFRPGLGAENAGSFTSGRDAFDLSHFANPPAAQWTPPTVPEDQTHFTADGAHDYGTVAWILPQHLHAALTSGVHLH
jgi:large repetitive protein